MFRSRFVKSGGVSRPSLTTSLLTKPESHDYKLHAKIFGAVKVNVIKPIFRPTRKNCIPRALQATAGLNCKNIFEIKNKQKD